MDLTLTPEEEAFRDEVRAWIADNHPGPAPGGGDQAQFEFEREWQRKLHAAGWAGISWPKQYGGRGATLIEQSIFGEELARAKAPRPANVLGLVMGGPVVIAHGTEEQKERFLEPILSAEEIWCQGFSEPESGSDLASLKTKAVPEDGGFRITGQKVWTTFAHEAKWCMLVARTDPDAAKHKGLTYFLLDMEQDEIEVRPLRQITGEAEFNELFIEGAYVPDENVVGGVGNGWMVAITTLMNERAGLGASAALGLSNSLDELIELAKEHGRADDPIVRDKVARLRIGIEGLRRGAQRSLTTTMKVGVPGPEGSIAKLQWSSTSQALTELAVEIGGVETLATGNPWAYRLLRTRANSIEGGTSDVLRNIVAERVLGLPKLR
jgi:alkylation response protein AidB-like acyl-CoA dehydrogenase